MDLAKIKARAEKYKKEAETKNDFKARIVQLENEKKYLEAHTIKMIVAGYEPPGDNATEQELDQFFAGCKQWREVKVALFNAKRKS